MAHVKLKLAEREVLSASLCFVETYRRQVLNPAILPLAEGGILLIQDTSRWHPPDPRHLRGAPPGARYQVPYSNQFCCENP